MHKYSFILGAGVIWLIQPTGINAIIAGLLWAGVMLLAQSADKVETKEYCK